MSAYKIFMAISAFAFFGCIGMLMFGYVNAIDEALKSLRGKIEK